MLFADHVNPRIVKWHQWRAPIWQWGPAMAPTVSTHMPIGLVVEYWPFVGTCRHPSHSKLYHVCRHASFLPLPPLTPPPYIHWLNINEFHEKIVKNWQKLSKTDKN